MTKKIQVPVIGGVRKTITVLEAGDEGTTLSGYGGQTLTLGQLATLLASYFQTVNNTPNTITSGNASSGSLIPGPGLSGGGPLTGNVPLNLTAPIPYILSDDGDGDGGNVVPGPRGPTGTAGPAGSNGLTVVLAPDEYDDPVIVPGIQGAPGVNGTSGVNGKTVVLTPDEYDDPVIIPGIQGAPGTNGATGLNGKTVFVIGDEFEDPPIIPGPQGSAGANGSGGSSAYNVTPDTHTNTPTNVANDEYEFGSTLDTTGARFAGAIPWQTANLGGTTFTVTDGCVAFLNGTNGVNNNSAIFQAIQSPATSWDISCKIRGVNADSTVALWCGYGASGQGIFVQYYPVSSQIYAPCTLTTWGSGVASTSNQTIQPGYGSMIYSLRVDLYLRMAYDGTNVNFFMSLDGVVWQPAGPSLAMSSQLTTGPADSFGIITSSGSNTSDCAQIIVDWFRRIA